MVHFYMQPRQAEQRLDVRGGFPDVPGDFKYRTHASSGIRSIAAPAAARRAAVEKGPGHHIGTVAGWEGDSQFDRMAGPVRSACRDCAQGGQRPSPASRQINK